MKKQKKQIIYKWDEKIDLPCKLCNMLVINLTPDIGSVICWRCTALSVAPPENLSSKKKPIEKRPRGWQFKKEYVSPSGIVYNFGKEVETNVKRTNKNDSKIDRKKKGKKSNG